MFCFHPYLGKWSNLTHIFSKRVGEKPPTSNPFTKYHAHTINVRDIYLHLVDFLYMFAVNVGKYTIHGCYGMGPHPCRLGHVCLSCFSPFLRQDVFRCLCRYDGTFREAFGAFALEISQRRCSGFKCEISQRCCPKNIPQKLCIRDLCSTNCNCNCWVWSPQAYYWGYVKVADLSPIHVRKQSRHRWYQAAGSKYS